ncbi:MAG: thioredoxin family protein [Thiovulaceae bacterium]|nr:thioredoxin family protein [Sulfurimonadaceae bacterium]
MKKIVLLALIVFMNLFGSELALQKSFKNALIQADIVQKPIMFIVSRHTCKYCVMLEKETLSKDAVIETLNKDYVTYIAYTDDDDDAFPEEFWRPATPTIWFLDDEGKAMSEPIMGAVDEKNLLKILDTVSKSFAIQKQEQQINYMKSRL